MTDTAPTASQMLGCKHCTRQFESRKGLSAHVRRAHPEHYVARPKYQSRATRLSTACSTLAKARESCEAFKDELETWAEEYEEADEENGKPDFNAEAYIADHPIPTWTEPEVDTSEVEALKDEMESWRDNMEEKLSQTQKYEMVDEAANALDEVVDKFNEVQSTVEGIEEPTSVETVRTVIDELDEVIRAIEEAESADGDVEFPGMY